MAKNKTTQTVRCAIYTRKSSEEGLEQEFNSLDAQREAAEAFISSQKHEGWIVRPDLYDDGGISGGTMVRPALKRLMADVAAGLVDAVVVYKVDRLSRSLGDFVKIVELFDRHGVSFVSVTQQFNTTTSMGRLTLNMLLSFAQFEREVTGERIRDKIAASKKKGMWMGGLPPLGYDVKDRALVVNKSEAETVCHIFRRYAVLGSVLELKDELDDAGIISKRRTDRHGHQTGGKPLARGALYHMLQNRIYRGEIVHKEDSYPGQHQPIIDASLWQDVQRQLAANRVDREAGATTANPSLLSGLIHDDTGELLTPSHTNKKGTRYRYYVSKSLVTGPRRYAPQGWRLPAGEIERRIEGRLRQFLKDGAAVFSAVEPHAAHLGECTHLVTAAAELESRWPLLTPAERRAILTNVVKRIDLHPDRLQLTILPGGLPHILIGQPHSDERQKDDNAPTLTFTIACRLKRTGIEKELLVDGEPRRKPDHSLHRLLARAAQYNAMIMRGDGKSIGELAAEAGVTGSYFTRVLRLSFLAPKITTAILKDRHPLDLTAKRLANEIRLPLDWKQQCKMIGTS